MPENTRRMALITGTTSGIGHALAKEFAQNGFDLILVSRDAAKLHDQQDEFEALGSSVHVIPMDLSLPGGADQVCREVAERGLQVDALVNNAGFNVSGPFIQTSLERELDMVQLHIQAMIRLTKEFLPAMVARGYGRILNVGSTGSFNPVPLDAVYGATKAFVLSFTRAIRAEVRGTGVQVSTLCPGATKTEFAKKADMEGTLLFRYGVMGASEVARTAFKGVRSGKEIIIPGCHNRLLVRSAPFTPSCVLSRITTLLLAK